MKRKGRDLSGMPIELAVFEEEDWPPVEGECLGVYTCGYWTSGFPYAGQCVPPPDGCGAFFRGEHQGDPDVLAECRRRDAEIRWRQARYAWLHEHELVTVDEWVAWLVA
jgi:hypothetical protein